MKKNSIQLIVEITVFIKMKNPEIFDIMEKFIIYLATRIFSVMKPLFKSIIYYTHSYDRHAIFVSNNFILRN